MSIFKSVEEYYEYMAQGHCCAPKFKDLADSAKRTWAVEFEAYLEKQPNEPPPKA